MMLRVDRHDIAFFHIRNVSIHPSGTSASDANHQVKENKPAVQCRGTDNRQD